MCVFFFVVLFLRKQEVNVEKCIDDLKRVNVFVFSLDRLYRQ